VTRPRQEIDPKFDEDVGAWFGTSRPITTEQMLGNVFRFNSLPESGAAFIDSALPGHVRVLMGAVGGAEYKRLESRVKNPELPTTIDCIRADAGNGAALHSHDVDETFICMTGRWRVAWGDNGEEEVVLDPYDGIAVPPGIMRSFENVSDSEALLLAVVGGPDPGHVVWAESMRQPLRDRRRQS